MAAIEKEMVLKAISNKSAKYVAADSLKSPFATVAIVENVDERKNINGVWVSTGRIVTRATVYFDDNTYTTTKSKHVIATIGALADEPIPIHYGFAVVVNKNVKFAKKPTLDVTGKTHDILTMTVGEE